MNTLINKMKEENKQFYTVNVPGKYGYSFLVLDEADADETVIDHSYNCDIFDDLEDADYAVIDDMIGETELKAFGRYYDLTNNGTLVELGK